VNVRSKVRDAEQEHSYLGSEWKKMEDTLDRFSLERGEIEKKIIILRNLIDNALKNKDVLWYTYL
jgi:hypothetical protein